MRERGSIVKSQNDTNYDCLCLAHPAEAKLESTVQDSENQRQMRMREDLEEEEDKEEEEEEEEE